jgi:hypothetical protein
MKISLMEKDEYHPEPCVGFSIKGQSELIVSYQNCMKIWLSLILIDVRINAST